MTRACRSSHAAVFVCRLDDDVASSTTRGRKLSDTHINNNHLNHSKSRESQTSINKAQITLCWLCDLSPCLVTDYIPLEWHKQICRQLNTDFVETIATCWDDSKARNSFVTSPFHGLCPRLSPKLPAISTKTCLQGSFGESQHNGLWA